MELSNRSPQDLDLPLPDGKRGVGSELKVYPGMGSGNYSWRL
jgi:hypothetical protein